MPKKELLNFKSKESLENEDSERISKVPEIFSLNDKQIKDFREKVEKQNGFARILVHPFYESRFENQKYYKALKRIIEISKKQNIPMVLFETRKSLEETMQKLGDDLKDNVLLVITRENSPIPELKQEQEDVYAESGVKKDKSILLDICRKLKEDFGLKKIIIGGQYLVYSDIETSNFLGHEYFKQEHLKNKKLLKKYLQVEGCVGEVAGAMAKTGIKTDLSLVSHKIQY